MAISRLVVTNTVINPQVNINEYPEEAKDSLIAKDQTPSVENQLTIGDLHGNALKLLYFLVRQNVIKMEKADYIDFVSLYRKGSTLTQGDIEKLNIIFAKMTANPVGTVRLIGDEFGDRGTNDYLTLKILERLGQLNVPFEILTSNHGIELFSQAESKDDFRPFLLRYELARSLWNLKETIDNGLVKREQIDQIIDTHVKPALRPISYTLSADKITIYTHAGIGLGEIASMAKKMDVIFNDESPERLAQTIDRINDKFADYVKQNKLMDLYQHEILFQGYVASNPIDSSNFPFEFAIWNRFYQNLQRPRKYKGYALDFVHGHDSSEQTKENVFNLDNMLGKSFDYHSGSYNVLFSQEMPSYQFQKSGYFESNVFVVKQKELTDKQAKILSEVKKSLEEEKLIDCIPPDTLNVFVNENGDRCTEVLSDVIKHWRELNLSSDSLITIMSQTQRFITSYSLLSKLTEFGLMKDKVFAKENLEFALKYTGKQESICESIDSIFKKEQITPTQELFRAITQLSGKCYSRDCISIIKNLRNKNLINEANLSILEKSKSLDSLSYTFDDLANKGILNQETFNILASISLKERSWNDINYAKEALDKLNTHNLLTPELIQPLIQFPSDLNQVANGLIKLKQVGLLSPSSQKAVLNNPSYAYQIVELICYFEKNKELTDDTYKLIEMAPDCAKGIREALIEISTLEKSTLAWRELIFSQPQDAEYISFALSSLRKEGQMSPSNLEIVFKSPKIGRDYALALSNISYHKLDEYKNEICKHPEYAYSLSEALEINTWNRDADKWKTPEVKQSFIDHPEHAGKVSKAFERLISHSIAIDDSIQKLFYKHGAHADNLGVIVDNLCEAKIFNATTAKLLMEYDTDLLPRLSESIFTLRYTEIGSLLNETIFMKLADLIIRMKSIQLSLIEENLDKVIQIIMKDCTTKADLEARESALKEFGLSEETTSFSEQLRQVKQVRNKFQEAKDSSLSERLKIAGLEFINELKPLFDRLIKAGLLSAAKRHQSQDILDKLIQMPECISGLSKEVTQHAILSKSAFNEMFELQRKKQIQKHPKGVAEHTACLFSPLKTTPSLNPSLECKAEVSSAPVP